MIIAIASGKGGTGKTTLATNLAHYLSQKRPVILADLDVEEPDSRLFLTGQPVMSRQITRQVPKWNTGGCSLCGLCQQMCQFNAVVRLGQEILIFPELCHSCYLCSELCPEQALPMVQRNMGQLSEFHSQELTLVESRLNIGEEQAVPLIKETLHHLDQPEYLKRLILLDAPPGTSCPVIEVSRHADYVILVTEPSPFGLHDLRLAAETMREIARPFGVVINRMVNGNKLIQDYCSSEGIELLTTIPDKRTIAEAYSRGNLVWPDHPEVRMALDQLEHKINQMEKAGI